MERITIEQAKQAKARMDKLEPIYGKGCALRGNGSIYKDVHGIVRREREEYKQCKAIYEAFLEQNDI